MYNMNWTNYRKHTVGLITYTFILITVPLYGDCNIDWGEQCGDRNAECLDEQCKCKEGYHAIYAYCSKYLLYVKYPINTKIGIMCI
jgi:hypothetical protein